MCIRSYRFLNKALIASDGSKGEGRACSLSDVEEAKAVLRLFPIWASSLIYAIIFAQSTTFFIKQGATMDRSITPTFSVPAASLQSFISLFIKFDNCSNFLFFCNMLIYFIYHLCAIIMPYYFCNYFFIHLISAQ